MVDRVEISIITENQPRWLTFVDGKIDTIEVPSDFLRLAMPGGKVAPYLARRDIQGSVIVSHAVSYYYFNMFAADGVTPNNNTSLKALTGQTTSDGVELDLSSHPFKGMDITAGYSYNYIRYTKTPDAKGNFIEGERLINNPASTGNASIFYTLEKGKLKGLRVGGSFFYTGTRYAGFNNTKGQTQTYSRNFEVEGFTTVDLSAAYPYKRFSLIAKLSNVTNTLNYYVHENYSVNPIPPRQITATISYKL